MAKADMRNPCEAHRRAFTLVELLVVVGIIVVLIALLFPVFSRARKQAYQVACLSNLRQVGQAFIAYASANKGMFPAAAIADAPWEEDWVHWQPGRDVTLGALSPYLGGSVGVLKCPMGVPERGPTPALGPGSPTFPPYPFSYSVNRYFTGMCRSSGRAYNAYLSGEGPCPLGKIISPSQKVLAVEEDTTGINDGSWRPDTSDDISGRHSSISILHDRPLEWGYEPGDGPHPGGGYRSIKGRGNVFFADGHCEFFDRRQLNESNGAYYMPWSSEPAR